MDLAEIPTETLAAELQRRYDVFFAVGVRDRLTDEEGQIESHWLHGEQLRMVGLIERAKFRLLYQLHSDSEQTDADDE